MLGYTVSVASAKGYGVRECLPSLTIKKHLQHTHTHAHNDSTRRRERTHTRGIHADVCHVVRFARWEDRDALTVASRVLAQKCGISSAHNSSVVTILKLMISVINTFNTHE